jgi:hypothetical protein
MRFPLRGLTHLGHATFGLGPKGRLLDDGVVHTLVSPTMTSDLRWTGNRALGSQQRRPAALSYGTTPKDHRPIADEGWSLMTAWIASDQTCTGNAMKGRATYSLCLLPARHGMVWSPMVVGYNSR